MARFLGLALLSTAWLTLGADAPAQPFAQSLAELLTRHGFVAEPWLNACREEAKTGDGRLSEALRKPVAGVAEALRRERQVAALRQLLDYRRDCRIPTSSAAAAAVATAEQQVTVLKQQACGASAEAFARLLLDADDRIVAARDLLDRHWPDGLVLRPGVGADSFGRYGWRGSFGGLVWDVVAWDRLASPATPSQIRVAPVGGALVEQLPPVVSWVSARHPGTVRVGETTLPWTLTESILAPGVLIETEVPAIEVSRGTTDQRGPDRLLLPARDTALSLRYRAGAEVPAPEDNWLLLTWEKEAGAPPVLVVFEKLPAHLLWTGEKLTVQFAGPAGKIAVGSYAGVEEWSPEISQAWQAVPRSVLKRCRELAAVLSHFPVGLDEFFGVDEVQGQVVITDRFQYVPFAFSGRISKQPAAALPPALTSAVRAGLPAQLPTFAQDWELATRSGPYRISSGSSATFRLPICRYDHPVLPASPTATAPLVLPSPLTVEALCRSLASWTGLAPAGRERLAQTAKAYLAKQLALVAGGEASVIEPHSLTLYVDFVANPAEQGSVASLRHSALLLDATYRYAKFSGDWEFVQTHTAALRDLLGTQVALTDWALMSPIPLGSTPTDALPDALRGALAMGQMAEAVQDRESLRLSRYLTARLLVPYGAGFLGQRATPANRWTEAGLPTDWSQVPFAAGVARVAGSPAMPELVDAAVSSCRQEAMAWLQTALPRQFPDWADQDQTAVADYHLLLRDLGIPADPPDSRAPIRLAEWQPAALGAFTYDPQAQIARLELRGATLLRCSADRAPTTILDHGTPLKRSAWAYSFEQGRLVIHLDDSQHDLGISFAPLPEPAPTVDEEPAAPQP